MGRGTALTADTARTGRARFILVMRVKNRIETASNSINGRRAPLPELLAPAGSRKAFLGAVKAGADAVYLGGEKFGARAYAENFTREDIIESVRAAHLLGKKVYLTLNVLTKESELEDTVSFAEELYEQGLDGAIVQDIGVLAKLHARCPGLALHASTQMSVTGPESVRFLKKLGVKRVVPARELSLKEIRILKEEEPIEVESFIHGAMCYAYSGRCLMSSFLGGRSGNRGRCAGTCRLPYRILDSSGQNMPLIKEAGSGSARNMPSQKGKGSKNADRSIPPQKGKGQNGAGRSIPLSAGKAPQSTARTVRDLTYPLSMRDMCVLEILPDLIDAGIDSFKIEGRMKSPHYAAGVSALYRKYIDRYVEWDAAGRKTPWKVEAEDMRRLRSLYLRTDLSTGYYYKRNGRDLLTITEPGYAGTDDDLLTEIEQKYLKDLPKREITGKAVFVPGEPARFTVYAAGLPESGGPVRNDLPGSVQAEVTGEIVQAAQKRPMEADEIEKRLRKTGDAFFTFTDLEVEVSGGVFLPVASLNALRRDALEALEEKILEKGDAERRQILPDPGSGDHISEDPPEAELFETELSEAETHETDPPEAGPPETARQCGPSVWALVTTLPQLRAAQRCGVGTVIVEDTPQITKALTEAERSEMYAALPYVMRRNSLEAVRRLISGGYKGVLVRNLEELTLLSECGFAGKIAADSALYQWNTAAREVLLRECDVISLGWELSAKDMQPLVEGTKDRQILNVYGRIPMMITAGCVKKTAGVCGRMENSSAESSRAERKRTESSGAESDFFYVEDRKGIRFPVRCDCKYCGNVIYNSLPQSLHTFAARKDSLAMRTAVWLCIFTNESGDETESVLRWYKAAAGAGEIPDPAGAVKDYTTGHYKKSAL